MSSEVSSVLVLSGTAGTLTSRKLQIKMHYALRNPMNSILIFSASSSLSLFGAIFKALRALGTLLSSIFTAGDTNNGLYF